jgi:uncharacterized protein
VDDTATPTFPPDDLDRLDALLAQPRYAKRALKPDALHGMLYALAIGPDAFPPDAQWQAVALDEDPQAPEQHDPALLDLLSRFAQQLREDLRGGRAEPLLYALRRGRRDYRSWCEGFLVGVNAAESDWSSYAEPEDFDALMGPIELLADALPADARRHMAPEQWRKRVLEAEAGLPAALERLRSFWTIVREPPPTMRREGAKVGRNDPCPYGSGRKFKQCHGRG